MKAIWNGEVIAESHETKVVEGNNYFPPSSLKKNYFTNAETKSVCPWKGEASYYSINVNGKLNEDAAWYYPTPSSAVGHIKDYVAFWKGVEIIDN